MTFGGANAPDQKRAGLRGLDRHYPLPSSVSGCYATSGLNVSYVNSTFQYDTKKMAIRSNELQKNDQSIT